MSTSDVLWVLAAVLVVALFAVSARMWRARVGSRAKSPRAGVPATRANAAEDARLEQRSATDRPVTAQAVLEEWRSIASERATEPRRSPSHKLAPVSRAAHQASAHLRVRGDKSTRASAHVDPVVQSTDPSGAGCWSLTSGRAKRSLSLRELEATLNYGAVRVRVEEARLRLIDKASIVCAAETDVDAVHAAPVPHGSKRLDADVAARVDSVLFEEDNHLEHRSRPRSSNPAPAKRSSPTVGSSLQQHGNARAFKRAYWRANGCRRPRGPLGRRRAKVLTGVLPSPISTRRGRKT